MLHTPTSVTTRSFADMLDVAFRFYRQHFLALWGGGILLWTLALALQVVANFVLSSYWMAHLLIFPLMFTYATYHQTSRIKTLLSPSPSQINLSQKGSLQQWWAVCCMLAFRLIMLVAPFALCYGLLLLNSFVHRADPMPMGSADTPEEQTGICLIFFFICSYPFWALIMVAGCCLAIPAIILHRTAPLMALRLSWNLGRLAFDHVLLTSLLIGVIYCITQLPTFVLVQMNGFALTPATWLDAVLLSAALYVGVSLALPINLILETFLYIRLRNQVTTPQAL